MRDQVVVSGGAASYDVEFTYRLTGATARGDGIFDSYFRPVVFAGTSFLDAGTLATAGFDGTVFYPEPGMLDSTIILTINDVPANTVFALQQLLQVRLFAADSQYTTDIDPFQTGDWDPSHILSQETLIGEGPYSVNYYGDLGNSLELQNVAVLDDAGNVAAEAFLVSQNGVVYPGQPQVPEPSTLLMLCSALAALPIVARRSLRTIRSPRSSTLRVRAVQLLLIQRLRVEAKAHLRLRQRLFADLAWFAYSRRSHRPIAPMIGAIVCGL